VEVLDVNGLQRRVEIFPEVEPLLVQDLHEAHVPFYVAPQPSEPNVMLVAFARAFSLTMLVMLIIGALGMMDEFIFGT
jgi:hypothetical protein